MIDSVPSRHTRFAAIDIGSNAVRLLLSAVFETEPEPYFRKISLIRMPIRLGGDAFIRGTISPSKIDKLVHTMTGFKSLIDAYRPVDYCACATSAMREADNGDEICERIRKTAGVDIQIINGKKEAKIIFANRTWKRMDKNSACMFVDVGGGSTEITLFSRKETVSASFNIGTLRLLHDLVQDRHWQRMEQWIKRHTVVYQNIEAIGSGGNINKLIKMAPSNSNRSICLKKLKKVRKQLKSIPIDKRITDLGLKPDRADVILPATKIYMAVLNWGDIQKIKVPQIGLADGLVRTMYNASKAQKHN